MKYVSWHVLEKKIYNNRFLNIIIDYLGPNSNIFSIVSDAMQVLPTTLWHFQLT
jgi:hypothetical protein